MSRFYETFLLDLSFLYVLLTPVVFRQCDHSAPRIERLSTLWRLRVRCMTTSYSVGLTSRTSECWTMFPLCPMTQRSCRCLCLPPSERAVPPASLQGSLRILWSGRHRTSNTTRWVASQEVCTHSSTRPVSCLRKRQWTWPSRNPRQGPLVQECTIPTKWKTKVFSVNIFGFSFSMPPCDFCHVMTRYSENFLQINSKYLTMTTLIYNCITWWWLFAWHILFVYVILCSFIILVLMYWSNVFMYSHSLLTIKSTNYPTKPR